MKRLLVILPVAISALIFSSTCVFAKAENPKKANRQKAAQAPADRVKTMSEKLNLTEEQQGKLKAILEKNAPKMKELRADTTLSQKDRHAKVAEIRKAEMQEFRAMLTPEQQAKMKELRAAGKGRKAAK